MSRYIEANKAMDLCTEFFFSEETCSIEDLFNSAPSIDIVRCKECRYWKDFECQCDWASTDHEGGASYSLDRNADDFCSYGEKQTERSE